ncbi:MAG: 50S ribosomal protein L24 [Candidatus Nanohaloarchaea archaeon]|nr:50S ribosomal protein L24 [Candidatus Nanohaloarchaea archaeon]
MSDATEWSASWEGSTDPSKQRKHRRNAPKHHRKKFLSAHLADSVQETLGTRTAPLRTGDRVEVMRGDFAGETGRVDDIDTEDGVVYIDGVEREAVDGAETPVPVRPSNLKVTKLNLDDDRRMAKYEVSEEETEDIRAEEVADESEGDEDEEAVDAAEDDEETAGAAEPGDRDGTDYEDIVTGTIDEVKDAVESGADPEAVLAAEQENKDRVTLVEWLEDRIAEDDTDE